MHPALLALAVLAGSPITQTRELMHTRVTVALADPVSREQADAAFEEAFGTFAEVDAVMNEWRPDSPLSRINAAAGKQAVEAPPRLCEVIRLSLEGARRTQGLFDPTWAALRGVWRFGDDAPPSVPSKELLESRCGLIDWKGVEVRELDEGVRCTTRLAPHWAALSGEWRFGAEASLESPCELVGWKGVEVRAPGGGGGCTVRLAREGMQLGLGGVAKGWGVDQAVARLRARGLKNFFVQAGGDLYLAGRNGDRPWRAGIRDPRGPEDKTFARVEVTDAAFSTSGDYERFFMVEGVRYHHIIDPRSCSPARASRSATVLAKSATDAEILTKAVFILGGNEGLALAESFGASAVLVDAQNRVLVSKGLDEKLQRWAPTAGP